MTTRVGMVLRHRLDVLLTGAEHHDHLATVVSEEWDLLRDSSWGPGAPESIRLVKLRWEEGEASGEVVEWMVDHIPERFTVETP